LRALLLAAGLGTRLRPLTDTVPKCLVPIHGRALLDYWLDLLFAEEAVERVLINTHHLADQVRAHVGGSRWADRVDLVHEDALLGTAGTLMGNGAWFGDGDVLVAHADNLTDLRARFLIDAHHGRPDACEMTMLTFRCEDPRSCGIVELDRRGIVIGFHEKVAHPPGTLANAAVYIVSRRAREFIRSELPEVSDLSTQVIPALLGRIFAVRHRGYFRDIGTPATLALAHQDFVPDP
jgi:mannose-1-phosphate guanylyltransferase